MLGLILAENAGLLPRPDYSVGLMQWVTYTALFGLALFLTYQGNQVVRHALARAEAEIEQRKHVEAELSRIAIARRCRCCCSMSTTSRPSTTSSATRRAIRC